MLYSYTVVFLFTATWKNDSRVPAIEHMNTGGGADPSGDLEAAEDSEENQGSGEDDGEDESSKRPFFTASKFALLQEDDA